MPELILRFHDAALDAFDWLVLQDSTVSQDIAWRSGSESDLDQVLSSHDMPVVFAMPQHCLLMTRFDLPAKASRQILSSIEYQIEDQLGDDIDQQHFAVGDIENNSVAIAVIKKTIMQRAQALQRKFGINLSKVIPELFLCPWSGKEGDVSILQSQDAVILRFGHYQGFECQSSLLKPMLDQLNRNQTIEQVTYFFSTDEAYEAIKIDGFDSQRTDLTLTHLNDADTAGFDLRQREFKRSSVWGSTVKPWKWVAAIFIAFLAIFGVNQMAHLQSLEDQLADIKRSQYETVKAHLPDASAESDNLKRQLIELIQQSRNGESDTEFLSQLVVFTKAKQQYKSVNITKINFQSERLSIDINSTRLNDVETLVKSLESSPLAVKLENLTIKPEFISGRLILGG